MLPLVPMSYQRRGYRGPRLLNCYAEQAVPGDPQPFGVHGCPGIRTISSPGGICRGAITHNGAIYAVMDNGLYRYSRSGSRTRLGSIGGSGRVEMASNRTQLGVLAGNRAYILDGSTLSTVTDSDLVANQPGSMTAMDGFFIFSKRDTNLFFKSNLYDGLSYDGDEFDLKSKYSDAIEKVVASEMLLILLGTESTEFWYYAGTSPFPYKRTPNGSINIGCRSKYTVAKDDKAVYFLASDNSVRAIGIGASDAQKISTPAVDEDLNTANLSAAWGFVAEEEGQNVYHLVLQDKAWSFNTETGQWHERASAHRDYWNISGAANLDGDTYLFSSDGGHFGVMDANHYAEWDYELLRSITFQNIYAAGKRAMHHELDVAIDTGWTTDYDNDPELMLELSDDGGETFRGPHHVNYWKTGEYGRRANFHRLGSSRNRVYRLTVTDDVKFIVRDAQLRASGAVLPTRRAA